MKGGERTAPAYDVRVERLGLLLEPNGRADAAEGALNPAFVLARNGERLLYPRLVSAGNVSRIGRFRFVGERELLDDGYALEPRVPYELREADGWGCEDPRVTYIAALDAYVMAYTAYGPSGARIALAISYAGLTFQRLGLVDFSSCGLPDHDDKDAAFFPEPVLSPSGRLCLAFYHRPMLHLSAVDGVAAIPIIEGLPFDRREAIRIAYVELEAAVSDHRALLHVTESALVLAPNAHWGSIKVGAGTPPIRLPEGWLSVFHGVDFRGIEGRERRHLDTDSEYQGVDTRGTEVERPRFSYSAGLLLHDIERPDRVIYRSPEPFLVAQEPYERTGIVNNVVFPTGIEPRPDLGDRVFDLYYGAADYAIAVARVSLSLVG